jgi:dipeptidyl aminopeptidase/acylaminoacyl peptidase
MAEVYRARDTRLGRDIALKVVNEVLAGSPELARRFEQEARLAGSLNHPNVVAVYDVGLHEGVPYFVTELLQGELLRHRLSRGRIPLQTALDWAAQIAHGLSAAHAKGVIHRDVKPDNVFISSDGHVKLLDFGIAKLLAEAARDGGSHGLMDVTVTPTGEATRTGSLLGTAGYMSPEQVRGEPLDARTDIFSFGAVVHEMVSGKRAFPGATLVESGSAILNDDPAPLPENVPPAVVQVVRRCLEKDREQRFQSARDAGFALDAVRTASGGMPPLGASVVGLSRRRLAVLGLAVVGVLAAVVAAFVAGQRAEQRGRLEARPLTFRRGAVLAARFAPDGRTVHYSAAWSGGAPQVFTTTIDSPEARPLGVESAQLLSVSAFGELAISLRPNFMRWDWALGTLARVPGMGGVPQELATDVGYADWAPDGERLAVARFEGGEARLEFPLGRVLFRSTGWVSHPRVSPSGDRVAFIDHNVPPNSGGQVRVVNADGAVESWSPRFDQALGLAWASGGTELLVSGTSRAGEFNSLWVLRRKQEPRLLYRAPGDLLLADVSPDGRLLVVAFDWRAEVEVCTVEGRYFTPEWSLGNATVAGLSDDGNTVLASEQSRGTGLQSFASLWNRRQSVSARLGKSRPLALSHDGHWALVEDPEVPRKLVLLPTGAGAPKLLGESGLDTIYEAAFFGDGQRVALVGRKRPEAPNQVWVLNLKGGPPRPISPEGIGPYSSVAVSPDQRWVAATRLDGMITAYSVEGAEAIRVEAWGPTHYVVGWLADGTLLAYERFKVPSRVERFDPRSGTIRPFTTLAPTDAAGVQFLRRVKVTPDGRTLAFDDYRTTGTLNLLEWKPPR